MVAEAQTCAIGTCALGIITILNILVALHLSGVLYKSTLFMQNKPNLLKAEMNVSSVNTMNYELRTMNYLMQNKPNSNPIRSEAEIPHQIGFLYRTFGAGQTQFQKGNLLN